MNNTFHLLEWNFIGGNFIVDETGNLSNTSNWFNILNKS